MRLNMIRLMLLESVALATLSAQTPQTTRVEENDPTVIYSPATGAWTPQMDPLASGGSYAMSTTNGSSVTFNFTGDTLTVYRLLDPAGGQADVMIDGKARGQLRFDGPARFYLVPSSFDNLGAGPHTIVLTVNTTPNNIYAKTTVYIDAFETPTYFVPTAAKSTVLTTLNQLRTQMGLPTATRLSVPLSLAAQAHAEYETQNNSVGPAELYKQLITGFTGFFSPDRMSYFGYPIGASAWEETSALADPTASINYWMGTVFNRQAMVTYGVTEIGFGSSGFLKLTASDLLIGTKSSIPPARVIVTYPANNQTNVPLNYTEDPAGDPLPGVPRPLGFPISLHITTPAGLPGTDNIAATGTLTDSTGAAVNAKLLWTQNDPTSYLRDRNVYYIIPLQPLTPIMQYTAHIVGLDNSQNKFDQSWTFTTGAGTVQPPPTPTWQTTVPGGVLSQISAGMTEP
jgi:Cysteine-rich secretory protein family